MFRAECEWDLFKFLENRDKLEKFEYLNNGVMRYESDLSFDDFRKELEKVPDGHRMVQTLASPETDPDIFGLD
jgi:hypothetical protein